MVIAAGSQVDYSIPEVGNRDSYITSIEELPLASGPEVLGLHPNAEIGYYTFSVRDMWLHLVELQPRTGTSTTAAGLIRGQAVASVRDGCIMAVMLNDIHEICLVKKNLNDLFRFYMSARCVSGTSDSGISPEAFVGKLASDILSRMPAVTDLRRLRRQYAASMTPTTVVLLQELERFNYLIVKMLQTLSNLGKVRRAYECMPA